MLEISSRIISLAHETKNIKKKKKKKALPLIQRFSILLRVHSRFFLKQPGDPHHYYLTNQKTKFSFGVDRSLAIKTLNGQTLTASETFAIFSQKDFVQVLFSVL